MKNWRNVAILGVLLLTLGSIASWDEWQSKKDKEAENFRNRLTLLKPEDIDELSYKKIPRQQHEQENLDHQTDDLSTPPQPIDLTIARNNGQWQILSPLDYPADQTTVESLLKTLTDYAYTQEIPVSKEKWVDFGLDDPQLTIVLKSRSKPSQEITVFVGSKAPIGYNVYYRTSTSDKVYMGSQHLLVSTNKSIFDFRSKKILHIDENLLSSIRYERSSQPIIEVVKNADRFAMTHPEPADTDQAEIKDFVSELNSLKAESIEDRPQGDLLNAFSKPELTVSWTLTSGEPKAITFTTYRNRLYASTEPKSLAFSLPDEAMQKLKRDVISFRDRRILSTDLLNVKSVEIDGNNYENINGNWYSTAEAAKLTAPTNATQKGQAKEQSHIRALMVDLEFAKTDKFYPSSSPEIASNLQTSPHHRLKIRYSDSGKEALVIDLFNCDDKDKYLVRRSDKSIIYRVPRSAFISMTANATDPVKNGPDSPTADDLPVDDSEDPALNLPKPSSSQPG